MNSKLQIAVILQDACQYLSNHFRFLRNHRLKEVLGERRGGNRARKMERKKDQNGGKYKQEGRNIPVPKSHI